MLLWPVRWLLRQVFQVLFGLLLGILLVLWVFRWVPLVPVPVIVALIKGEGPSWQWLSSSERPPGLLEAFRWRLEASHAKRLSPPAQAAATLLFPDPGKAVGAEFIGSVLILLWGEERLYHLYLSGAPWGPRLWGVKSASHHYLQKAPQNLSPDEIAEILLLREFPQAAQGQSRPAWFQKQKQVLARQIAYGPPQSRP